MKFRLEHLSFEMFKNKFETCEVNGDWTQYLTTWKLKKKKRCGIWTHNLSAKQEFEEKF